MTWGDEGRALPPDWPAIVARVKKRAATALWPKGQCEKLLPRTGKRCPRAGVDVDHKGDKDDHRLVMLRLLCEAHHDAKTAAQGHAGWAAKKAPNKSRPRDEHPGRRLR